MDAVTSEKTVLKMVWDRVGQSGANGKVPIRVLVPAVRGFQDSGVSVYSTREASGIADAIRRDVRLLVRLGYMHFEDDSAELTGAGELFASTLRYPKWAERRLNGRASG